MRAVRFDVAEEIAFAFMVSVGAVIWAFNVHEDRTDRQELRIAVVEECADAESPKTCAKNIDAALEEL